jgi:hypothetical protein
MCFGGSDPSGAIQQEQQRKERLIRQGSGQIESAFSGFNPQFYQGLQQNYLASTLPQLARQYQTTQGQLSNTLSNQGLLRSSAARNLGSSLQVQNAQNIGQVGNQATQAVQDLQKQIQQQKSNLLAQLQVSTDPTSTAQQAAGIASQYQAPSLVQPLGNLFQNWSNIYLSNQFGKMYGQQQLLTNRSNTGLAPLGANYNYGG